MHVGMWSHPREVVEAQSYSGRTVQGIAMPATLDETYAPRYWRCDECRRVLGVVMRDSSRIRKLWVFRVDKDEKDVPTTFTLRSRPRGLFKMHGVHSCEGVECSLCGARTEWTPSKEAFDALMSHFREVPCEPV